MNKTRVLTVVAALAMTLALYAVLGFFLVPAVLKQRLSTHVEHQLGHKLALGEVRFNPFTFGLEASDFNLQEADGGALFAFKRLYVNFEAISVFQRAWDFAEITLEGPLLYGELRKDGSSNFTALLAALHDPQPKPDTPPPPLKIQLIRLTQGGIDLVDWQAGGSARLRIAPIALELTAVSTLSGEKGPYKLTARTADRELIVWDGDISLNPIASTGKLAFSDWKLATFARLLGSRISIDEPAGTLQASLEYVAGYAAGKPSLDVKDFDLRLSQFSIVPKGSPVALAAAELLALSKMTFALGERSVAIQRAELSKGQLAPEIDSEGRPNWSGLLPARAAPSAAPDAAGAQPSLDASGQAATSGAEPAWRVKLNELAVADLTLRFADRGTRTELGFQRAAINLSAAAEVSPAGSTLVIDGLATGFNAIAIDMGGERIELDQLEFSAPVVKASFGDPGPLGVGLESPAVSIAGLAVRQATAELTAKTLLLRAGGISATAPAAGAAPRIEIADVIMESAAVTARPAAGKKDALEVRALDFGAESLVLALGGETPDAIVDAMRGSVTGVVAREPAQGAELLRLERAQMRGGALTLRERRITVETLLLANANATATIDNAGKSDWDAFIAAFAGTAQQPPKAAKPAATPAWKAVAKNVELQNVAAAFGDRRQSPPMTLGLIGLNARASNLGTDQGTSSRIALTGRIKDGGELAIDGRINPHTFETDLKVKVSELSLLPAQPFLGRHARLQIVSALGSAQGRLRYGLRQSAGADLVFEGDLGLSQVAVEETEPQQPFLTLDALHGSEVKLTIGPNRLDIPDLRIDGFSGKLLIAEDQSVNLVKVLRPRAGAAEPSSTAPAATPPATESADGFPVALARIRIDGSRLEFADLTLRPQFAARMHDLKGVVTGVSTERDSRAQADLEARVDEFGSARIRGEINIFQPRVYTDIDMTFRNLEMTSLTPYTAKFAGYRIASGKLSMDLKYRIKDSALVGENKLVLDKLELGERVESPTAFNLPLELAIAILKDSDGKIDIGLPVSGSLDDPQFSYGQLIWKAIGNLFGRILTAPFRALASLFGGSGSEKLEAIEFDPGRHDLLPPEKQKLRTVAEALSKRPQLKLTVKPAFAEKLDRAALQSDAVRREVALRSGIKLAPGEDPGPVDYSNPRTQRAIETLYIDRNSAAAARDLRAQQKPTAAPSAGSEKPAAKPPAPQPAEIARAMAQQLFDAHPVPDTELAALAKRRGDTIAAELNVAGKIDSARLDTANPQAIASGADRSVTTALELSVAK